MAGRSLVLAATLGSSFLCNTLLRGFPGANTATPEPPMPSATAPAEATEAFPPASYLPPACTQGALPTVDPATLATQTPVVATNPEIDTNVQLRVLDQAVDTVEDVYVYPDYNGIDWPGEAAALRDRVQAGVDTASFYREMTDLITGLNDEHSRYETPSDVVRLRAELAGENDFVGVGVVVEPLPESNRVVVLVVFPDSPAEHAGLRPHDSILAVDGQPLVMGGVAHPEWVRGPECSTVVLTVESPGGAPSSVAMVRTRLSGAMPIDAFLVNTGDTRRIGYIFIPTYFDETIPEQVESALHEMAPLDGLILDNRKNGGGSSSVIEPILGYFTSGTVGEFRSRTESRPLRVEANPIENSQTVPLIVLIGKDTVSFGEITSGILGDIGRARLVGQTTEGNVEVLHGYSLEDGSELWIAEEAFDPLRSHANWEQDGIVPDVFASAPWYTFTQETDPAIQAAIGLFPSP